MIDTLLIFITAFAVWSVITMVVLLSVYLLFYGYADLTDQIFRRGKYTPKPLPGSNAPPDEKLVRVGGSISMTKIEEKREAEETGEPKIHQPM